MRVSADLQHSPFSLKPSAKNENSSFHLYHFELTESADLMHGILIEGDNNKWYESGGVQDITIRNNTFENIGYGNGISYPLLASPLFTSEQKLGDQKFHQNINFTNNAIKSFNGHLVHAMSVKGLNVSDNIIEMRDDYPTGSILPAIDLEFCEDVVIEKNQFKKFNFSITSAIKDNNSKVKIKKNKGLLK